MKQSKSSQWIDDADEMIRKGQGQKVRDLLAKIQRRGVPKDQLVECANLARRVGMSTFALNILFRTVYQDVASPEPRAVAEYAANSSAAGNYIEANKLFENLPSEILGQYCIEYADSLFKSWNYEKASSLLDKYAPSSWNSYRDMVFGLNYASSLIETKQGSKAIQLLEEIIDQSKKQKWEIILANALELLGQTQFHQRNYTEALQLFIESEDLLRQSGNISWVYSRKWKVITAIAQKGWSPEMAVKLNEIRKLAREYMHWETLRDCDFYESYFSENSRMYSRVYFGTPHESYRNRIKSLVGKKLSLFPSVTFGKASAEKSFELDVSKGDFKSGSHPLELTPQNRRLLQVLTSELYRPLSIFEIFKFVFNEPYFNPTTSKDRTYKAIAALKKAMVNHPGLLSVTARKGYGYRFRTEKSLLLHYPEKPVSSDFTNEEHLLSQFGETPFTRREFCDSHSLSERSGNRQLQSLVEEGLLEKIGSGSATKYKKVG